MQRTHRHTLTLLIITLLHFSLTPIYAYLQIPPNITLSQPYPTSPKIIPLPFRNKILFPPLSGNLVNNYNTLLSKNITRPIFFLCSDCMIQLQRHVLNLPYDPDKTPIETLDELVDVVILETLPSYGFTEAGAEYFEVPDRFLPNTEVPVMLQFDIQAEHQLLMAQMVASNISVIWNVTIVSIEENIHIRIRENILILIFYRIILSSIFMGLILYASRNLYLFVVSEKGFKLNIGEASLLLEIFANAWRFIHVAVDPFATQRIYVRPFAQILWLISAPFTLMVDFLLACFWLELISVFESSQKGFLDKYLYPYLAISIFVIFSEILESLLRGYTFLLSSGATSLITQIIVVVFYLIILLFLLIFYFYNAYKVLSFMKIATKKSPKKAKSLLRMTHIVIFSGGGLLLSFIITAIGATPFYTDAVTKYAYWWICYFSWVWTSLAHIYAFQPKRRKLSSTLSGTQNNSGTAHSQNSINGLSVK